MTLPSRAVDFLETLFEFLDDPSMQDFVAEARARYFDPDRSPAPELTRSARSYVALTHRDRDGRTAVDRFLLAQGSSLSPEEREAFEGLRASTFGLFEVESRERDAGMRLRRVGTDERFEVTTPDGPQVGQGIFVHLVPYRGRYYLAERGIAQGRYTVQAFEQDLDEDSGSLLENLSDPAWFYRYIFSPRNRPVITANLREAEQLAHRVFAEFPVPWTVEEVQARVPTLRSTVTLVAEIPPETLGDADDLVGVTQAISELWNHTPRAELGGLSPHQKAQKACGGRPPGMVRPIRAPAGVRDPESLAPPERPLWTPESRLRKLRELLEAEKLAGAVFVAGRIVEGGDPLPEEELGRLLDRAQGDVLGRFFLELPEEISEPTRSTLARLTADRIDRLREPDALVPALRFLARTEPARHVERFRALLRPKADPAVLAVAVEGLVRAGAPGADERLVRWIGASENPRLANEALALALAEGPVAAIPAAVRMYLDSLPLFPRRSSIESPLEELPLALESVGLGSDLALCLVQAELVLPYSLDDPHEFPEEPISAFLPVEDPAAARRAAQVVSPERRARIRKLRRAGDPIRFLRFQIELAREAVELAPGDNPAFAELGARLAAFLGAIDDLERLEILRVVDRWELSILVAMVLVKAIRGHDFRVETPAALEGRPRLLELLRVDEDWLREDIVLGAISLLSEEDLLPLVDSRDSHVAVNARTLLSAMRPETYLLHAFQRVYPAGLDSERRLGWSATACGERLLTAIHAGLTLGGWRDWERDTCPWLAIIATERAREYFRARLEELVDKYRTGLDTADLLAAACVLGDGDIAWKVTRALETSGVRVNEVRVDTGRLRYLFQALFDLHDIDENVDAVLEHITAATGRDLESNPFDFGDEDWDDDDDDDPSPWLDDTGSPGLDVDSPRERAVDPRPDEPYRRETSKVGRNDPCPCGSGKKYKRCCGLGE